MNARILKVPNAVLLRAVARRAKRKGCNDQQVARVVLAGHRMLVRNVREALFTACDSIANHLLNRGPRDAA